MIGTRILHPDRTMSSRILQPRGSPYCRVENFLAEDENRKFLDIICKNAARFETSGTTTGAENYRKSLVLYPHAKTFPGFLERLESCMPVVTRALARRRFPIKFIDLQVTAHNDGDYFKIHSDSGSGRTRDRAITFVYYLHRMPKPFNGGELVLYARGRSFTIEPANNTMLFFRSEQEHAVQRIRCRSRKFEDSRFTINGWICR